MNNSKSKEIKVGAVTILAILLFIIGITLGNQYSVSVDYTRIKLRFSNSGGIDQSSPVFINGVKRGKVISVIPDKGSVLITAEIDDYKDLKVDVSAKLSMMEITGGKKIEIIPGISNRAFNPRNEISGINSPDIGDMVALLGDMGSDAKILLKKLDTIATAASSLMATGKGYERLESTIANTSEMVRSLNNFVQGNIRNLEIAVTNLKTITVELKSAIEKYEPKADIIVTKLDNTLDDTQKLIKSADEAIANANKLISKFNDFAQDIKDTNGLVSKLIYDKKFADKMDSTIQSLNDFINTVKVYGININARLGTRP